MAQEVLAGELGEGRAAHTTTGGDALTTAATLTVIPDGAWRMFIIPRNFATAVVARIALNPYLIIFKTSDALATNANATDYSVNAQDAITTTLVNLDAFDTAANNNYLYVGSHLPFRGARWTNNNANAIGSVLTVKYWNGTAWTDITASDGTTTGGATFAQTGNVTWTMPTDWVKNTLIGIASPAPATSVKNTGSKLYWTRWEVSVALSATTRGRALVALNRSTAYTDWPSGSVIETRIRKAPGGIAAVEALTDAGTANLIVNVFANESSGAGFVDAAD